MGLPGKFEDHLPWACSSCMSRQVTARFSLFLGELCRSLADPAADWQVETVANLLVAVNCQHGTLPADHQPHVQRSSES